MAQATADIVTGAVNGLTSAPSEISKSVLEWLQTACGNVGGDQYASCYFVGALGVLLTIHYLAFVLENLGAWEYKGQTWKQAFSEVRQFIQNGVVRWIVYFGAMMGGLLQGMSTNSTMFGNGDLKWAASWAQVGVLLMLVKQFCVLLTGQKSMGNAGLLGITGTTESQLDGVSAIGYGPLVYANVSRGAQGAGDYNSPWITQSGTPGDVNAPVKVTSWRPWYVVLTWWLTVTDIVLSNIVYPSLLGWAGGKFAIAASGRL